MVNVDTGQYVALNRTASAVWEALASPCTQPQLEAQLIERFEISASDCHAEVDTLLQTMHSLDLSAPLDR